MLGTLPANSVSFVFTSPPYADHGKQFPTFTEPDYPTALLRIMSELRRILTDDGSVCLVIRAHVCNGVESDYVDRTKAVLRQDGWTVPGTLIWHKPDAPALGSKDRPRRTWEFVLWFSKTSRPYIDLRANGAYSSKLGEHHNRLNRALSGKRTTKHVGKSRMPDLFVCPIRDNDSFNPHPTVFPVALPEFYIRAFSKPGDTVLDPFCGSGSTLIAAVRLGRNAIGIDIKPEYVELSRERLVGVGQPQCDRLKPEFQKASSLRTYLRKVLRLTVSDVRLFSAIIKKQREREFEPILASISDLSLLTSLSRMTVMRSLRRMEERRCIERTPSTDNRSPSLVSIARTFLE